MKQVSDKYEVVSVERDFPKDEHSDTFEIRRYENEAGLHCSRCDAAERRAMASLAGRAVCKPIWGTDTDDPEVAEKAWKRHADTVHRDKVYWLYGDHGRPIN